MDNEHEDRIVQASLAALSQLDGAQGTIDRVLALSATQISKQVVYFLSVLLFLGICAGVSC